MGGSVLRAWAEHDGCSSRTSVPGQCREMLLQGPAWDVMQEQSTRPASVSTPCQLSRDISARDTLEPVAYDFLSKPRLRLPCMQRTTLRSLHCSLRTVGTRNIIRTSNSRSALRSPRNQHTVSRSFSLGVTSLALATPSTLLESHTAVPLPGTDISTPAKMQNGIETVAPVVQGHSKKSHSKVVSTDNFPERAKWVQGSLHIVCHRLLVYRSLSALDQLGILLPSIWLAPTSNRSCLKAC